MSKTQQFDSATYILDRPARLFARKRAQGILRGKTAVLIKETARIRKEWNRRLPRSR